jgi:hypothetical protein
LRAGDVRGRDTLAITNGGNVPSSFAPDEVAGRRRSFPTYKNGDLFLSWGELGVRAYAGGRPEIAVKCVNEQLILAIAYVLLCGIGLIVLSSTHNECSVFTMGKNMLKRVRVTAAQNLAAVMAATEEAVPKWG